MKLKYEHVFVNVEKKLKLFALPQVDFKVYSEIIIA